MPRSALAPRSVPVAPVAQAEPRNDRFLALVGHELRTPLASIQGYVRLLLEGPDLPADERAACLGVLDREAGRLGELVEDLLRAARLQSGGLRMSARLVDPFEIARGVVAALRPFAERREVHLECAAFPRGTKIQADLDLWPLTLRNLVSNALLYTQPGGTVAVAGWVRGGEVFLAVADNGPGIDGDELPHVFDRFFRGRAAAGVPGSGLGLSIARDIAWRHRGELGLRRMEAGGTLAEVRYPLVPATPRR